MSGHPGTRPHVGARQRTLDPARLADERARLLSLPVSAERSKALLKLKRQIYSLNYRSERRGA